MSIFWQECKHILYSRFLWIVATLGIILATLYANTGYANLGWEISLSYEFTEQHGFSFEEKM